MIIHCPLFNKLRGIFILMVNTMISIWFAIVFLFVTIITRVVMVTFTAVKYCSSSATSSPLL
jgi:hypothetical protein